MIFFLAATLSACDNFDKRITEEAQTFTQQHLPQQLDENTRLDSMTYDKNNRTLLQYHTLTGVSPELLQNNRTIVSEALLAKLKEDPKWKDCKDEGITFSYIYYMDGEKQPLLRFDFTTQEYSER